VVRCRRGSRLAGALPAGGLVVLVRCRGGSRRAGALPPGGLDLLVRCPRGSVLAGALPRLVLGVVSERASTGRLGGAAALVLGPWPSLDARFCVRAWGAKASASTTGSRHRRRSVRPSAHEGRIVGALGGGVGSASPFPWHGPREGGTSATSGPVGGGSSTCTALRRWQIHRRRRFGGKPTARPSTPTRSPRPRTSAAPSRPVEALAERRTSRSRGSAAPPQQRAAPTQPHPESKPHQRSPSRERSRADDVRRPGPAVARPGGGRSPCAGRR
jgi:hypothetical protein